MQPNTVSVMTRLLSDTVLDVAVPQTAPLTESALAELFALAQHHDVAHLLAPALEKNGLLDEQSPFAQSCRTAQKRAILRHERMRFELQHICAVLEDARIPFVPLKGAVVGEWYPQGWMRTGCDIDVLVHREHLEAAVQALTAADWQVQGKAGYHDISLRAASGVHLELHFSIEENIPALDRVLQNVWQHCAPVQQGRYQHRQSNEFLLLHLLAHMSYHFMAGGCGVRPFLDIELLRRKMPLDAERLNALLRQAELERFYQSVCALCDVWFGTAEHTPLTEQTERFIITGGVYGSRENRIVLGQAKAGGRAKHLLQRVFLPYDKLRIQYPVLQRHRFLTPVFWPVRWCRMLFGGKLKRSAAELRLNQARSNEQITQTQDFLQNIGL